MGLATKVSPCGRACLFGHLAMSLMSAFFACSGVLNAQQQNSARAFAVQGWTAFQEGRLNEAKELLSKAVRLEPAAGNYQAALATVDARTGDLKSAIKHFRRAILLDPSNSECRLSLAEILQTENNDQEALRVLQDGHPAARLSDVWHFTEGFSLFRIGRFTAAIKEFKTVEQKPEFEAPASFFLGNIAYSQGDFDRAESYLAKAVALGDVKANKAYNAYTYDYGLVLMKLGKFADAEEQFKASIARYDDDPLPWMFAGRCEEEKGNYHAAIELLEASIKKDPSFQLSYYELARLQQRHGDPARAAELFRKISTMKEEEIKDEENRAMKLKTTGGLQ